MEFIGGQGQCPSNWPYGNVAPNIETALKSRLQLGYRFACAFDAAWKHTCKKIYRVDKGTTYNAGWDRMMLNILSTRLTFWCQLFPVPQYSACQCVPRSKNTIPVGPGLHHISCRISDVSQSNTASCDRNVVQTLANPSSGGGCSCESCLFIIQFRTSGGTIRSLISWWVRSGLGGSGPLLCMAGYSTLCWKYGKSLQLFTICITSYW